MARTQTHVVPHVAIAFDFQGLYALVALLEASDGARVSVEFLDDVTVAGDGVRSRIELKHSIGGAGSLTIKSDDLWKTIKVWCDAKPLADDILVLVTCAAVDAGSELHQLTSGPTPRSRRLIALFDAEADRVCRARANKVGNGNDEPFGKRAPGCEAWLELPRAEKQRRLARMRLVPSSFSATEVGTKIESELRKFALPEVRSRITEHLIEWWQRQVVRSILGQRERWLAKSELQTKISELIIAHSDRGLPDNFSGELPPDPDSEPTGIMARQIELVAGGLARITRAATARWRSRAQRERWLSDDVSIATELDAFDDRLIGQWRDRFEPMQHDCAKLGKPHRARRGLSLLDWSHLDAHSETSIRPLFTAAFLVQGSYQQLADEQRVGWHPDYRVLLAAAAEGEC
jgi:hypothetical protein